MVIRYRQVAFVVAIIVTSSCAHAGAPLAGSEWNPLEIAGVAVPAESQMFVRFGGEGRLEGNGGCNGFFGTYKLDGDTIAIGPIGATRRACEESVMDLEMRLFDALAKSVSYARERIALELRDGSGIALMRLRQTDAD